MLRKGYPLNMLIMYESKENNGDVGFYEGVWSVT
jgi:hypothetical protein